MFRSFKFKYITVEPSLFFFLIVYALMKELNTNFNIYKTCQFNRTTEPDMRLNNTCDNKTLGIEFSNKMDLMFGFPPSMLNTLMTIFITSWSDQAGRRRLPLIYLPLIGQIFTTFWTCINSYYWEWHPLVAVLTETIIQSFTGGIHLMIIATQLYVCDISDLGSRTLRLGLLGSVKLICQIFGKGGSGLILTYLGFFYSYLLCFIFSVLAFTSALIFIKDTSIKVEKPLPIYRMFNFKQVFVDNFKVIFHQRHGIKRIIIIFLIVANVSVIFTYFGELGKLFLYFTQRFNWSPVDYSKYMVYKFSTSALGLLFCSVVLSKLFHVHDSIIGVMAGVFDTIAILGLFFAIETWQIYLVPLVDIFHGTAMVIGMSLMTKYYDTNELGQLSSVTAIFSIIGHLSFPVYGFVFERTLNTLPSAFCLISAVIDVLIVLCYSGAYIFHKKYEKIVSKNTVAEFNKSMDGSFQTPKAC